MAVGGGHKFAGYAGIGKDRREPGVADRRPRVRLRTAIFVVLIEHQAHGEPSAFLIRFIDFSSRISTVLYLTLAGAARYLTYGTGCRIRTCHGIFSLQFLEEIHVD
jgi:hypothetical protein